MSPRGEGAPTRTGVQRTQEEELWCDDGPAPGRGRARVQLSPGTGVSAGGRSGTHWRGKDTELPSEGACPKQAPPGEGLLFQRQLVTQESSEGIPHQKPQLLHGPGEARPVQASFCSAVTCLPVRTRYPHTCGLVPAWRDTVQTMYRGTRGTDTGSTKEGKEDSQFLSYKFLHYLHFFTTNIYSNVYIIQCIFK